MKMCENEKRMNEKAHVKAVKNKMMEGKPPKGKVVADSKPENSNAKSKKAGEKARLAGKRK